MSVSVVHTAAAMLAVRRQAAFAGAPVRVQRRWMGVPGWKTMTSTKDARSKEQREAERVERQLDKLPKPQPLHAPQHPFERAVLADQFFQPAVYVDELDAPRVFNPTSEGGFAWHFDHRSFDERDFPPLPVVDPRRLAPCALGDTADDPAVAAWAAHCHRVQQYLRKHGVSPVLFPFVGTDVNAAVIFGTTDDAATGPTTATTDRTAVPLPLGRSTFWSTAHAGNPIPAVCCRRAPAVYLQAAGLPAGGGDALYTLLVVSPDYPYRNAPGQGNGSFLHAAIVNISPCAHDVVRGADAAALPLSGSPLVRYIPPLPTEDAGATRVVCAVFRQTRPIDVSGGLADNSQPLCDAVDWRRAYRMNQSAPAVAVPPVPKSVRAMEEALAAHPSHVSFFYTDWDVEVQEFYVAAGLPEPAYTDAEVARLLRYNALPRDYHHIRVFKVVQNGVASAASAMVSLLGKNSRNTFLGCKSRLDAHLMQAAS